MCMWVCRIFAKSVCLCQILVYDYPIPPEDSPTKKTKGQQTVPETWMRRVMMFVCNPELVQTEVRVRNGSIESDAQLLCVGGTLAVYPLERRTRGYTLGSEQLNLHTDT